MSLEYTGKVLGIYPQYEYAVSIQEPDDEFSQEFEAANEQVGRSLVGALKEDDFVKLEVDARTWKYTSFIKIDPPTLEERVAALEELVKELQSVLGRRKL